VEVASLGHQADLTAASTGLTLEALEGASQTTRIYSKPPLVAFVQQHKALVAIMWFAA